MRFNKKIRYVVILLVVTLGIGLATQPALSESNNYEVKSELWFEGTSTVRDWACKDVPVEGNLKLPSAPDSTETLFHVLESVPNEELETELAFPVKKIGCEQGERMNKHLRKALKAKEYPNITFRMTSIDDEKLTDTPTEQVEATINGDLTIKDTTKTVEIPVQTRVSDENTIRVKGELPLDITEYGVTPPTVMWTITVYDDITIHPKFTIRPGEESKD